MRKRVPLVIGGGIALLVASQYMDFGLGFRGGDESVVGLQDTHTKSTDPELLTTLETTEQPVEDANSESADESSGSEANMTPEPPLVVDVLIDGDQYLVLTAATGDVSQSGSDLDAGNSREPISLEEIVAQAKLVQGEPSGIKVRIARTPRAIASAETALQRSLSSAGLQLDEIDARRQLVEDNDELSPNGQTQPLPDS